MYYHGGGCGLVFLSPFTPEQSVGSTYSGRYSTQRRPQGARGALDAQLHYTAP